MYKIDGFVTQKNFKSIHFKFFVSRNYKKFSYLLHEFN